MRDRRVVGRGFWQRLGLFSDSWMKNSTDPLKADDLWGREWLRIWRDWICFACDNSVRQHSSEIYARTWGWNHFISFHSGIWRSNNFGNWFCVFSVLLCGQASALKSLRQRNNAISKYLLYHHKSEMFAVSERLELWDRNRNRADDFAVCLPTGVKNANWTEKVWNHIILFSKTKHNQTNSQNPINGIIDTIMNRNNWKQVNRVRINSWWCIDFSPFLQPPRMSNHRNKLTLQTLEHFNNKPKEKCKI